ncbi:degV domain-containing protein [Oscillospiraceae bacterium]|nr:degV domain-containing protein [Oscillospiraceae bacterium]
MKIAVVTDSNSGIFEKQAKQLGVYTLPMPFCIDGAWLYEGVDLSAAEFYEKQAAGAEITTSQPSPADVTGLWEELLKTHDQIVHIPMTSALSSGCATAQSLAQEYGGRVQVADNRRISLTQQQAVKDAALLARRGHTAAEIRRRLEEHALDASIYVTADTLKYLKKGGRVTPGAAAIGTVLNIKPVLQIQGGPVDACAKVRGMRQATEKMLDALCADLTGRFEGMPMHLGVAWSGNEELGRKWHRYVQARFPKCRVQAAPLALSIACHTGPGALGVGCFYYEE